MFEDEGHSGATQVRPALEALRDVAAQGCLDVVLCYPPDRLARKFAYHALLVEEFNRARGQGGVRQRAARRQPRRPAAGPVPGHVRRIRESPAHGALPARQSLPSQIRLGERAGRRPVGYRYVRRTPESGSRYEIIEHEAVLAAEMFRRYAATAPPSPAWAAG